MTVAKLELINVKKIYGDDVAYGDIVAAVDGVDLTLQAGKTLALLGPSGCGKSTTLNMIVGLEQPSSGDIRIDGESVINKPPRERNIGLVFQDYAVFQHMSVRSNLSFGLRMKRHSKKEIEKEVAVTAELLGLSDLLNEKASRLGGSQLQRVAIGRTLITKPSLLLLDEPLSNLEYEARVSMRQELRRLNEETGLTIIYVTHDQLEALSLADTVAVMSSGKIRDVGPTETIYKNPGNIFVARFIGDPPTNILDGYIDRIEHYFCFSSGNLKLNLNGLVVDPPTGLLNLGLRPDLMNIVSIDQCDISGVVTLVRPRGPDTVVTIDASGHNIQILIPTSKSPDVGEEIGVKLLDDCLSFFHYESGKRLNGSALI